MLTYHIRAVHPPRSFQQKLQLVSLLGAGLLCGTALAVIIPEGVELLQDAWRGERSRRGGTVCPTYFIAPLPHIFLSLSLVEGLRKCCSS